VQAAAERAAAERAAAQRLEAERIDAQRAAAERAAAAEIAVKRAAARRAATERAEAEQAEAERLAAEQASHWAARDTPERGGLSSSESALLLRELSGLGTDEPEPNATPTPVRPTSPGVVAPPRSRRKGLFGR
jgi:chemosensory pili system protein ChpA (sensor histidine kinase/response regulator)